MASDTATQKVGRITQVIGSTFDAQFDDDKLPDIYNAVEIDLGENGILTGEVQQPVSYTHLTLPTILHV